MKLPRLIADSACHASKELTKLDTAFNQELERVRQQGISTAEGLVVPGINALAAPVFDEAGTLVLSLTAIGASAQFDVNPKGSIATTLKTTANDLSARLGYRVM